MKVKPVIILLSCFLFMSVIVKAQIGSPTVPAPKKPSEVGPPPTSGDAAQGNPPSPVTNIIGPNPPPVVSGVGSAPIPVRADTKSEAKADSKIDLKTDKISVEDKILRPGNGTSLIIQSEIQNKNEEARASLQDYLQFRDPFKSPEVQNTVQGNVSQLEKYIVTEYKLTGVMTGPIRMRAMILSPDGKAHFVSEGMKLGNRGGTIKKITTKSVVVRERTVNALGEEEFTTTQILMTPETNGLAGK